MPGRLSEQIKILNKGIRQRDGIIEEQEEKIRDLRQLAANQDAEMKELRKRMAGVSAVLDDLISSEIRTKELIEDCRDVMVKMKAETDKMKSIEARRADR